MGKLTLEMFTSGLGDVESRQYEVLQGLKELYDRFSHNKLYPDLSDIIQLENTLEALLYSHDELQKHLPRSVTDLDLEQGLVIIDTLGVPFPELERIFDSIAWAIPLLRKAIVEGTIIYNFVEENISIEEVGIVPAYRQEGYWFVPELKADLLHLLRYEMSLISSATERFRSLKTTLFDSLEERAIKHSPESVKLSLMERYADLPNPATYRCEVDIEFPYQETILPVAKRKLMARLVA